MKQTEEEIDQEFSEVLRDMPDETFWKWVATWKDAESICEEANEWSIETKTEELAKLKEMLEE